MASTSTVICLSGIFALAFFGSQMIAIDAPKSVQEFPPQEAQLQVPVWVQFCTASVLLFIFAAAVQRSSDKKRSTPTVLPQPGSLALRHAIVAGLLGAHGALHAAFTQMPASAEKFPSSDVQLNAPIWARFLMASSLLTFFSLAVRSDVCADTCPGARTQWYSDGRTPVPGPLSRFVYRRQVSKTTMSKANVVPQVGCFAGRLALVAALFAIHVSGSSSSIIGMFTSAASFPPGQLGSEIPAWAPLLSVSLLLCVFAAAIDEDDVQRPGVPLQKSKPSMYRVLPEAKALARRFAAVTGLLGTQSMGRALASAAGLISQSAPNTMGSSSSPVSSPTSTVKYIYSTLASKEAFPLDNAELEAPLWCQLFVVSCVLCVFATAIAEDDLKEQQCKQDASRPRVVPHVKSLAMRFAILLGLLGSQGFAETLGRGLAFSVTSFKSPIASSSEFPLHHLALEEPVWCQLFWVSLLLCVFATALGDDKGEETSQPYVVPQVKSLAFRFAAIAGLASAHGAVKATFSASSTMSATAFPPGSLALQVPVWSQFLAVSLLLLVFAAIIRVDADEASDPSFLRLIVWSLGIISGFLVVLHDAVPVTGTLSVFPSAQVTLGVPACAQIGFAVVLLSAVLAFVRDDAGNTEADQSFDHEAWRGVARVFAKALKEGEDETDQNIPCEKADQLDEKVDRSKQGGSFTSHLAVRLAILFGLLSLCDALCIYLSLANPFHSTAFPSTEATVDVPTWFLLGVTSCLLLVFAAAVSNADQKQQYPLASVVALKLSAASVLLAGCYAGSGVLATSLEAAQTMLPDVSGDSVLQVGVSLVGVAAVLSDGRVQNIFLRELK